MLILRRVWMGVLLLMAFAPPASYSADVPTYPGKISPLVEPILLRYAPVHSMRLQLDMDVTVTGGDPQSVSATALMEGTIIAVGEQLELRQSMWMARGNQNPKSTGFAFKAKWTMDRRGNWTDIDLSGVNPADGTALKKGTAAYDNFADEITSSFLPFPAAPLTQGDDLLANLTDAAKLRYLGSGFPSGSVRHLQQIIVGETILSGRRGLVTQLSGDLDFFVEGQEARFSINGYVVFDVASGMRLYGRLVADGTIGNETGMRLDFDMNGGVE